MLTRMIIYLISQTSGITVINSDENQPSTAFVFFRLCNCFLTNENQLYYK